MATSPAENRSEHLERYDLPEDGADVIIYTGFGYKGCNVINARSLRRFAGGYAGMDVAQRWSLVSLQVTSGKCRRSIGDDWVMKSL
jgi:hypothetical protein